MARVAWQPRCAARHILPQIARRYKEYSEDWAGLSLKRQKMTSFAPIAKLFKPDAPNRLWETDMTYVWCGMDGWCYCFNVVDCFTRGWISYAFDVDAAKQVAIDSITNAVSVENPDCSRLRLRTDNGTQYTSNDFRKAVSVFGIKHEFIWKHAPEQNGHVESFHKTLKKEYLWRREFASYQEAEKILADAFADYNQERIHSAIGYMTPVEFASQWEMKNK